MRNSFSDLSGVVSPCSKLLSETVTVCDRETGSGSTAPTIPLFASVVCTPVSLRACVHAVPLDEVCLGLA